MDIGQGQAKASENSSTVVAYPILVAFFAGDFF